MGRNPFRAVGVEPLAVAKSCIRQACYPPLGTLRACRARAEVHFTPRMHLRRHVMLREAAMAGVGLVQLP